MAYRRFQDKYFSEPLKFCLECVDWRDERLEEYQQEIIQEFWEAKRYAVRGPHGLGKTTVAALILHWFALTRDGRDWKAITTASRWRQLTVYLWPEVDKWNARLKWDMIGRAPYSKATELLTHNLKLATGAATAVASNKPDYIEGAHAKHLLYIFDESKSIGDGIFDAAEGAFSNAGKDTNFEAMAFCVSTPGAPIGRFYQLHARAPGFEDWRVKHITKQRMIEAGRMSREWERNRRLQWGENSTIFKNRVEGEFAAQDENAIVPLAWIELAFERWAEWEKAGFDGRLMVVSSDIAEGGKNKTVIAPLYEVIGGVDYRFAVRLWLENDHSSKRETATMDTVVNIRKVRGESNCKTVVDAVGVGAGVAHRLVELNIPCIAFKGGQKTERLDQTKLLKFKDWNSCAWYTMREFLDPENGAGIAFPYNDTLIRDLTTRRYRTRSDGVIEVESKKEMRERLKIAEEQYQSPDYGDTLAMAVFAAYAPVAGGATGNSQAPKQLTGMQQRQQMLAGRRR